MTVEHNIAMRRAAEALVELATEEYGRDERFWEVVRNHAVTFAPMPPTPPSPVEPLSDEDARKFGVKVLGFGCYRDQRYDEVPLEYLMWIADKNTQLVRYIRSRRVQSEMTTREGPTEEQDR